MRIGSEFKHGANSEIRPEEMESLESLLHVSEFHNNSENLSTSGSLTTLIEFITINDTDVNIKLFEPLENQKMAVILVYIPMIM